MTALSFLVIMAVAGIPAHGEEVRTLPRPLDEFRSRCIPLWPDVPAALAGDCTVAEFGEVGEFGESAYYYARYHDRTRPIPDDIRSPSSEFNVLVVFETDGSVAGEATVVLLRKPEEDSYWRAFRAPVVLETNRGAILYLQGDGMGDGSLQYQYDEYWLWQSGSWVAVDVHSWINGVQERLPNGYRLKGIIDLAPSLMTLGYVGAASRDGDRDCCPMGGTVSIRFEWDDLTLRVARLEHDPGMHGTH